MRVPIALALLIPASIAPAQGPDTSTPPELLEARAHYEEQASIATKPIRDRYIQQLEQLKTTAYYTRNFDLAEAVTQEIASMNDSVTELDPNRSPGEQLKARLVNSTWIWWSGETITLLPNGMARWSKTGAPAFTWKIAGAAPVVIEGGAPNGKKYRITLDAALRTGKLEEAGLPERQTSLIGFK
jgi:hypothetical protein